MPTPISPSAKKILDELRGGVGTPVTPQSRAILDELQQQAPALPRPAPVQLEAPTPPRPRNPNVQYGPSGRVVDPTTGQEFGGGAHENAPQPTDTRGLESALTTAKDYAFKPLTFFVDPINAALNAAAQRGLKEEATGGPVAGFTGVFKGLVQDAPAAALKAVTAPPTNPRFLAAPLKAAGAHPAVAEVAQFLGSTFLVDPQAARLFGGMMGFAGQRGRQAAEATGLLDARLPVVGKSVRALEGEARLRNVAKQAFVRGDALAGQLRREGDQVLKKVEATYNAYRKRGVEFATTTADGRRVNAADELVSDWIEAGTPGAKFASRAQAEAQAPSIGLEVRDLRDLGSTISNTYQKSGRWLEQVGFLKPGTVNNFGGRYVARLYHVASHNPGDVEAALKVADELGAVSPQATELANRVLQKAARGGFGVGKERHLTEFGAREGYLAERQAGVTLGAALPKQARVGARGAALQQITENPELFIPLKRAEQQASRYTSDELGTLQRQVADAQQKVQRLENEAVEVGRAHREAARLYEAEKTPENLQRLRAAKARADQARKADAALTVAEKRLESLRRRRDAVESEVNAGSRDVSVPNEAPPGWIQAKVGPVEGYFHPVAYDVIQQATKVQAMTPAQKLLQAYAGKVKAAWASYNPAVQIGNIKQNIALAEGAAAARGLHWNAIRDLLPDLKAFKNASLNPGSDPYFEALASRSRAFTGESKQLGEVGSSLRNSLGIDTTAQRIGKGAKWVAEAPMRGFGHAEEVFKYSLFKRLVKGGISEDEAARITDKALFDHTDVDARVAALNKYGIMPFLNTRIKGLENSASIWLKNPDILLRHSGYRLAQTAKGIAGPEAQTRDQLTNPSGKLRIPVPGLKDPYGRQQFVTGQLFAQNPLEPLMNPALSDPFSGGVFGPILGAARNVDQFKEQMGQDPAIVKPGELPPLDAILQRVKFAAQGTLPTLTPFIGREWERVGRAAGGQTRYGGAGSEPESLTSALMGALTGTRLVTPETDLEKTQRSTYNVIRRSENQRFLAEYMGSVQRGETTPETFPDRYFPEDPKALATYYRNALSKVKNYVTGGEDVPGSLASKAKIRHLADWLMALENRYQRAAMTSLDPDVLIAAGGGGNE